MTRDAVLVDQSTGCQHRQGSDRSTPACGVDGEFEIENAKIGRPICDHQSCFGGA